MESKKAFKNMIESYQKNTENQLKKIREENHVAIIADCNSLFEKAMIHQDAIAEYRNSALFHLCVT